MILGQDFDCETNYDIAKINKQEDIQKNPTWRNLLFFLKELNISPTTCFFTNAILGVRKGDKGTGKSPAFRNPAFIEECRKFFQYQIEVQRPKAIFVLGKYTAEFLAETTKDLECWRGIKNFATVDKQKSQIRKSILFNKVV